MDGLDEDKEDEDRSVVAIINLHSAPYPFQQKMNQSYGLKLLWTFLNARTGCWRRAHCAVADRFAQRHTGETCSPQESSVDDSLDLPRSRKMNFGVWKFSVANLKQESLREETLGVEVIQEGKITHSEVDYLLNRAVDIEFRENGICSNESSRAYPLVKSSRN
ncbi:hypothetical protein MPTK2_4g08170 [Marchantia polymorpha subsp. ruderalis]